MSSIELETHGKHDSVVLHVEDGIKLAEPRLTSNGTTANGHSQRSSALDLDVVVTPAQEFIAPRKAVDTFHQPPETLHIIINGGTLRANRTALKTVCMSIMAGILISFGGNMGLTIASMLSASYAPFAKFAWAAVFPFGLMLIFMHQGELFTGNVMYMIAAYLRGTCSFGQLVQNWVLCYIGNYAGCVCFAFFISYLPEVYNSDPYNTYLISVLVAKVNAGWGAEVLKAVACNFLVCTSIWWFNSAEDLIGKLIGVWWPICCFVLSGFEHCIANMFYLMLGLMVSPTTTSWGAIFAWNIIPVTIGNIIGATIFILFQFMAHGWTARVSESTDLSKKVCLKEGK